MKTRVFPGLLLGAALVPGLAMADDKAACLDAAAKGQRLRGAHQLVEAREQMRACAAAQCPAVVQTDCARWLDEVEAALPTVVVAAKNGSGVDLFDVKVSVDGKLVASKLDGQGAAMNAGPHTFHFEGADGTSVDQQVMIKEGEKNQVVSVVLGASPAAAPGPAGLPATVPETAPATSSPLRTVGWVLGGAGMVGLGVGAVFGLVAMSDKNAAHCVDNLCDPGKASGIKSAALVSDIGWIAGGVLLATGAGLVLFAPSGHAESAAGTASAQGAAALRVTPVAIAGGGGALLGGAW
jgi:hypothetical protein